MGRIRRAGAGRKRIEESAPEVTKLIDETVVNLIGATKTRTGLRVKAVLDTGTYPKGIKVEDQAMRDVRLRRHTLHPDWNYTIDSLTS